MDFPEMVTQDTEGGTFRILPRASLLANRGQTPPLRSVILRADLCLRVFLATPAIPATGSEAGAEPSQEVGAAAGVA